MMRARRKAPFRIYYVSALLRAHGFYVLRVPVSPEQTQFISLTNACPPADWQEREIQDLLASNSKAIPIPVAAPCTMTGRKSTRCART